MVFDHKRMDSVYDRILMISFLVTLALFTNFGGQHFSVRC